MESKMPKEQLQSTIWASKVIYFALIGIALLMTIVMLACEKSYPNAIEMKIDFSWHSTKDVAHISPEIILNEIPDGTKQFLVELKDLDCTICGHGSGYVDYTGEPVIKTGAVKGSYVGPRPPPGNINTYEITVKALNEKEQVIGIGKQTNKYPMKK